MADEPNSTAQPATSAAPAPHVATPQSDPTPAQAESRSVVSTLTNEIDDLWARVEGRDTPEPDPVAEDAAGETAAPPTAAERTRDANGRFQKAEPPAPETPTAEDGTLEAGAETPPPALDREAIIREERARIQAEADERERVRQQVEREQQHRQTYEAYIGAEDDYGSVNAALRASQRGDDSLLDALDVVLPNGKRVSQVRPDGQKGLTAQEAASLLDTWDANRGYEDVMGTRKVQQILAYWDAQTVQALQSPDVDAARVRSFSTPGEQMQAAIDSTREAVERRLTEQHAAAITAKDAEIEQLTQRIASLTTERTALRSGQRAASAATPDRPGQPGALRTDLPTVEQLREMTPEEAFKGGHIDRLFQSIPGGQQRRRTG